MTWVTFERAAKFTVATVWATSEIIVREQPHVETLVFIASVLGVSEAVRAVKTFDKEETK